MHGGVPHCGPKLACRRCTEGRMIDLSWGACALVAASSPPALRPSCLPQVDGMAAAEDDDTGIFGQAALLLELSLEEGQPQLQQGRSQAPSGSDQLEHMLATLAAAAAAPEALVGLLCWAAPCSCRCRPMCGLGALVTSPCFGLHQQRCCQANLQCLTVPHASLHSLRPTPGSSPCAACWLWHRWQETRGTPLPAAW